VTRRRELPCGGGADEKGDDDRGDDRGSGVLGGSVGHEPDRLEHDDSGARDEQAVPDTPHRDGSECGEDDRCKGGSRRADSLVERERGGPQCRAEEAERGERLRRPRKGDDHARGRDACRRDERPRRRKEVVQDRGRSERRVAARDPSAAGRQRRVQLPVAAMDHEPCCEDEHGRARAERNPGHRADPPAVRGEHEEEDDAEERHDAAGERYTACAEQIPVPRELRRASATRTLGRLRLGPIRGHPSRDGPALDGRRGRRCGCCGAPPDRVRRRRLRVLRQLEGVCTPFHVGSCGREL
jgi:hypothetical protein